VTKKATKTWLSDDPPRPWLLWTVRSLLIALSVLMLAATVPNSIERVHTIRATMPVGPERQAALDSVIEEAVTSCIAPLLLLAIFGFGVFPRQAPHVWNTGGPWFIPIWRSEKKKPSQQRRRSSGG
jgi:hypothetical protein